MRRVLPLVIVLATAALVAAGWSGAGGFALRAERSAATAEQAVRALMADIQAHNWDDAYASLDHRNDIQKSDFIARADSADNLFMEDVSSISVHLVVQNIDSPLCY